MAEDRRATRAVSVLCVSVRTSKSGSSGSSDVMAARKPLVSASGGPAVFKAKVSMVDVSCDIGK